MKKPPVILLVSLVMVLTSCSSIGEGKVVDKEYEPAYSWIQMMCSSYSSSGACTVYTPITHRVSDKWRLDLEQGEDSGSVYVTEENYNHCGISDHFPTCAVQREVDK